MTRWVRTSIRCWKPAATRPTSSTRRSSPRPFRRTARWSCARRWPGCCGASSTTSTTCTAGCASTGSTRGTPNAPASSVRNVPWFHMVAGDVISMPDKWEYPWFAAWDLAFHCAPLVAGGRRLRQGAGRAAAQHQVPAPERPDPGLRVELQRRQPARHGVGGALRVRARGGDPRRGRSRVPGPRLRAAADELHLVGEPQGPRRAATSSRAGSSASTTSASSTARRRCPAAARSSRRTARRGWRSIASGCCRSPVELAKHDPAYGDMALKFVDRTSSGSRSR